MSQQTINNADIFGGNIKELRVRVAPSATTAVVTGAKIKTLKHGMRIKRANFRAWVVGATTKGGTIILGYGAAVGTMDTIFGTVTITDVATVSITDDVACTAVDVGANGVPDNQDIPAGKILMYSITKGTGTESCTFPDGELCIEYQDRDTNA